MAGNSKNKESKKIKNKNIRNLLEKLKLFNQDFDEDIISMTINKENLFSKKSSD